MIAVFVYFAMNSRCHRSLRGLRLWARRARIRACTAPPAGVELSWPHGLRGVARDVGRRRRPVECPSRRPSSAAHAPGSRRRSAGGDDTLSSSHDADSEPGGYDSYGQHHRWSARRSASRKPRYRDESVGSVSEVRARPCSECQSREVVRRRRIEHAHGLVTRSQRSSTRPPGSRCSAHDPGALSSVSAGGVTSRSHGNIRNRLASTRHEARQCACSVPALRDSIRQRCSAG
jgi:hypothetical protein